MKPLSCGSVLRYSTSTGSVSTDLLTGVPVDLMTISVCWGVAVIHLATNAAACCRSGGMPFVTMRLCPPLLAKSSVLIGVLATPKSGASFFRSVGMRYGPCCSKATSFRAAL